MTTLDLYLFLTSYTFVVAISVVAEHLRSRDSKSLPTVVLALISVSATAVAGYYIDRDTSYFGALWFLVRERDFSSVAAIGMGAAAALVWMTRRAVAHDSHDSFVRQRFEPFVPMLSIVLVVACGQAFLWNEILGITRHSAYVHTPEFVIEKVADLDEQPLRVAADKNGKVYICYDYFRKHGAMGGAILELSQEPVSGDFQTKVVVEAPFLARPYGLAVRGGDLFVSRSGFFPKTAFGKVTYGNTGAVTQLKDLDGDGYFEYAHDVVSNLPGVRAPDTMQQNNGIAFAEDGSLFVTSAGAADRTLDEHPWGGTILRVSRDFTQTEVYARGFRNPWEVTLGPDDELFATDSDIDKNPGDELNHVVQGAHYGHPFVVPNEAGVEAVGFREPILVGERETVYLGIAYTASPALPEKFRSCLYVADLRQNRVLRMELVPFGDTYKVSAVHHFATVPSPVDIAITPAGEFFVISRRAQKVYRISPVRSGGRTHG